MRISKWTIGIGIAAAWFASVSQGQTTFSWTNGSGGSYHSAGNWSPGGGPPIFDDHASFNLSGTYGVTFGNVGTQTLDFHVRQGNVTFSYLNTTAIHNWNGGAASLIGPNAGDAATSATLNLINMFNNPMRGGDLIIGHAAGKTGTLNINTNGRWQGFANADVTIGSQGTGNLNVTTSGILQVSSISGTNFTIGESGGTGNATISGVNASMNVANVLSLGSGTNSLGNLTISNQGQVNVTDSVFIGAGSNLDNKLSVIGSGSKLQLGNDTTQIGFSGKGRLRVLQGAEVNAGTSTTDIGNALGSVGELEIDGAGSQYVTAPGNNSVLTVGHKGTGLITVANGGLLSASTLTLGKQTEGIGTVEIVGTDSAVDLFGAGTSIVGDFGQGTLSVSQQARLDANGMLIVGNVGVGQMFVSSGGEVHSTNGSIGQGQSGSLVNVSGAGSIWTSTEGVDVGWEGQADLNITNGGLVQGNGGRLGVLSGSTGNAAVNGPNSQWNTEGSSVLSVGQSGSGNVAITNSGSIVSDLVTLGSLAQGTGNATIQDVGSQWTINKAMIVGDLGQGSVHVTDGGTLQFNNLLGLSIAQESSSIGKVLVSGANSLVQMGSDNMLTVGLRGTGSMKIEQGGTVESGLAFVGSVAGSSGAVTVRHAGSSWSTVGKAEIGRLGVGDLLVQSGGSASADNWFVGSQIGGQGTVKLSGAQASLVANQNLVLGGDLTGEGGEGHLSIGAGTLVDIGSTLRLYSQGSLDLKGGKISLNQLDPQQGLFNWQSGTVEFKTNTVLSDAWLDTLLGTNHTLVNNQVLATTNVGGLVVAPGHLTIDGGKIQAQQFSNIGVTTLERGSMQVSSLLLNDVQGTLVVAGTGQLQVDGSLLNNGQMTMAGWSAQSSGGALINQGVLSGTGRLNHQVTNQGLVQVDSAQHLKVVNLQQSFDNHGQIQLASGRLEVAGSLVNLDHGLITGHGVLDTNSSGGFGTGLSNHGTVAVSGAGLDVYGDVRHVGGAKWVTSGLAKTTFWDDVEHNGFEIRTAQGSSTVFYGSVSGAGPFTGTGDVYFEGDLKPGNSPANVWFEGNVTLGQTASVLFELDGYLAGSQYDQLTIDGLVALNGELTVDLADGFRPILGTDFLLINNRGGDAIMGQFAMVDQGQLWWSGERRFLVNYFGGDGNDFVLTAIPEPHWFMLGSLALLSMIAGNRSRKNTFA